LDVKSQEIVEDWRMLHNDELYNLYASPNNIQIMKLRRMRWAGHVARVGKMRTILGFDSWQGL